MAVGIGAKFEGFDADLEQRRRLPSSVGDGRYEFVGLVGEGRHKRVYRAVDCHLGRDVALALIKAEAFDDLGEARVWREAESIERLSGHPNTVAFYDSGEDRYGRPYLVTELVEGGDLCERLAATSPQSIPLAEVLRIAGDVASALAHVHAHGIVHRDVKPENVWVTAGDAGKLGDFGLSLPSGECQPGCGATIEGTPAYMPPEQALGAPTDERADLYSLGTLLYELLCAQPPFVGDDPAALVRAHLRERPVAPSRRRLDAPKALDSLVLSLLEKAPADRPSSASEVLDALADVRPSARSVVLARRLGRRRGRGHVPRRVAA
jgi:serine/threonine protein kinase